MKNLYIIVPCYNEEAVLKITSEKLQQQLEHLIRKEKVSNESKIIFVDDGSNDSTWNVIKELCNNTVSFGGIKLSRNKGHQNALLAGLMTMVSEADMMVTIDADFQDDVNAIEEMVDKCYERHERVAGKTKYSLKNMISFAIKGIISLSAEPIQLIAKMGMIGEYIGKIYLETKHRPKYFIEEII